MTARVDIFGFNIYIELHFPAGRCNVPVADVLQVACHQCKQVTGLGKRIFPHSVMPAVASITLLFEIAVGQQHRIQRLVSFQPCAEPGHHIGSVEKPGDFAETFSLALGTEHGSGAVETFKRGIVFRVNAGH